jgi:hypothetical protein
MSCNHSPLVTAEEAMRLIKSKQSAVCWSSSVVEVCEKCGENIKHLRLVETMTVAEDMKKL